MRRTSTLELVIHWITRKCSPPSLHFECNDLFLIQHLFSTPQLKCFLKCLQNLYPAQNPAVSEVAAIPTDPCALSSPWKEARQETGSRSAFCRPVSQASNEEKQGKQRDGTWLYLPSVTKMPCSFPTFLARHRQFSPPTKLQSVKENVCRRDSLCLEFSLSSLQRLLSRPGFGYLLP